MEENRCSRCGGSLRQVAVLANYKSFVVSLMRCQECGATLERKENAHRPSEQPEAGPVASRRRARRREVPFAAAPRPSAPHAEPAPAPEEPLVRRHKPAKRIERPFNIRVTRKK